MGPPRMPQKTLDLGQDAEATVLDAGQDAGHCRERWTLWGTLDGTQDAADAGENAEYWTTCRTLH